MKASLKTFVLTKKKVKCAYSPSLRENFSFDIKKMYDLKKIEN